MLLVGLAGETPQVQSCTIRALIYNMKNTIQVDFMIKPKYYGDDEPPAITIDKLSSTDP